MKCLWLAKGTLVVAIALQITSVQLPGVPNPIAASSKANLPQCLWKIGASSSHPDSVLHRRAFLQILLVDPSYRGQVVWDAEAEKRPAVQVQLIFDISHAFGVCGTSLPGP